MCEPNFINVYHIENQYLSPWDNFSTNAYNCIILKSCWYKLCINPADLFNDIFPICNVRWMENSLYIDWEISSLWLGYKIGFRKNKQKKSVQHRGSKHDNTMCKRRRQSSTGEIKKKNEILHSVTPFAYTYASKTMFCNMRMPEYRHLGSWSSNQLFTRGSYSERKLKKKSSYCQNTVTVKTLW